MLSRAPSEAVIRPASGGQWQFVLRTDTDGALHLGELRDTKKAAIDDRDEFFRAAEHGCFDVRMSGQYHQVVLRYAGRAWHHGEERWSDETARRDLALIVAAVRTAEFCTEPPQ